MSQRHLLRLSPEIRNALFSRRSYPNDLQKKQIEQPTQERCFSLHYNHHLDLPRHSGHSRPAHRKYLSTHRRTTKKHLHHEECLHSAKRPPIFSTGEQTRIHRKYTADLKTRAIVTVGLTGAFAHRRAAVLPLYKSVAFGRCFTHDFMDFTSNRSFCERVREQRLWRDMRA